MAQNQNVGIGTTTPDASARLDVSASDQGFLMPRLTTVQRLAIVAPATGLMLYDTDTNTFWYHDGAVWIELTAASAQSNLIFSFLDQGAVSGTAESAIASYVLPANTIAADGDGIEIHAFGEVLNDTSFIRFKIGPNQLEFPANVTGSWNAVVRIYRKPSGQFKMAGTFTIGENSYADVTVGIQDFTIAAPFQITAEQTTAVFNGVSVEGFAITHIR